MNRIDTRKPSQRFQGLIMMKFRPLISMILLKFGFVVMGHEFDCYQKKLIRDTRNWNWFLEEPIKDSDDEDDREKIKKEEEDDGFV
ncbi:hypothetical protein HanHA300_Chr01g0034641 [Helianthus annuus]|nr:hypothetical protein HanHA300_Chr01g0034641 [Helianthus annuus]KAJ0784786.1 hypothetical protein HanLR1_Chr01g0035721 [Helianthus annuus]KAJ0794052.1 hypothetical protein HanOQP8_Chr01g0035891 [Helianthus annuus]